jgi:hypothetical protein
VGTDGVDGGAASPTQPATNKDARTDPRRTPAARAGARACGARSAPRAGRGDVFTGPQSGGGAAAVRSVISP